MYIYLCAHTSSLSTLIFNSAGKGWGQAWALVGRGAAVGVGQAEAGQEAQLVKVQPSRQEAWHWARDPVPASRTAGRLAGPPMLIEVHSMFIAFVICVGAYATTKYSMLYNFHISVSPILHRCFLAFHTNSSIILYPTTAAPLREMGGVPSRNLIKEHA